ncbi:MAG: hypothetical protein A2660_02520 [Candidatus Doudnabacteria bacterium RIFCSPHIGHO2_01_FULL_45_18]|uniref:Uncharacterized protein n=1 Tax=Candidatus Doudnabacteria bacterium RIFCSPHIGHO2_01_FULL_45_18 TaxID=1817823 RepID=A0A1F5NS49_9BACT|nr:MAG: hypothetical protein A2660_02520 [Candidatus Doudnabacteria bacterium RIFCSPHIGHO2_01_FULL_45_18]
MNEQLREKYSNLKKRSKEKLNTSFWSLDNIRDGLNYFFEVYKRYPTVPEVDKFEFLPTARTIQRSFGGLVSLRRQLNLARPTNYNSGEARSILAGKLWKNAREYEEAFYNYLIEILPEVTVHEHKILRPGGVSCDFFIYNSKYIIRTAEELQRIKDIKI